MTIEPSDFSNFDHDHFIIKNSGIVVMVMIKFGLTFLTREPQFGQMVKKSCSSDPPPLIYLIHVLIMSDLTRLKDGKCRRKDGNSAIDLLYQKHLYCSVEKPLFESDPEILKASETYVN
jgi:hypothetical protein